MNPFVQWLLAVLIGVIMAMVGLFIAAVLATYVNIWAAGLVLLLLFFGAIIGLSYTYGGE